MTQTAAETSIVRTERQPQQLMQRGLPVHSFEDLWRLATAVVKGRFAPRGLDTTEQVFAAMSMGLELGLAPMASLRGIAVINGRPSIYGDIGTALIQRSGLLEYMKESIEGEGENMVAWCEVKRIDRPNPRRESFSVKDAKLAGLWGKGGPWMQYPKRMLKWRARSWACRDEFADVLQGLSFAEEVGDIPNDAPPVSDKPRTLQVLDEIKGQVLDSTDSQDPAPADTDDPPHEQPEPEVEGVDAEPQTQPVGPEKVEIKGIPLPAALPDSWRTDAKALDDAIRVCQPENMTAHAARKSFHAKDVNPWPKLSRERQDAKYQDLLKGTVWMTPQKQD